MASFAKSVGGSPTNIAIGAARLGLKAGLITGVGDEQLGRFIREQLAARRRGARRRQGRPGAADRARHPLGRGRHAPSRCSSTARTAPTWRSTEADIDESFIPSAGAIVVTGTHFSKPGPAAAQRKAMRIARAAGRRVAFDIDYRPNLWGLAGHAAGRGALRPLRQGVGASADGACRLRPDRRHRGGDPHRRRRGGHPRRAPPHPRAVARPRSS